MDGSSIRRLLATTALGGFAVFMAVPASAQTDAQGEATRVEEVVVTGSRVDRKGFEAPTPVTTVSSKDIERANVATIADQLNKIPSLQNSQGPVSIGNTSQRDPAANFLNLRGLGTNRTLTLVDGQRFVPNSALGVTDANLVPFELVQRVDIVSGGASAAYGSDAVAGVVNFILDHHFNGLKGNVQGGVNDRSLDKKGSVSFAAGRDFLDGRLNVEGAFQYFRQGYSGLARDYPWGTKGGKILANPGATAANGQYPQIIATGVRFATTTNGGLILGTSGPLANIQFGAGGAILPFVPGQYRGTGLYMVGGGNPGELLDEWSAVGNLRSRRTNFYGRVGYEVTPNLNAAFEVTYAKSSGRALITGNTDIGTGSGVITIQRNNAYLPAAIAEIMDANKITSFRMGRLNPELGFIQAQSNTEVRRYVASLDGRIGETWKWNAYIENGESLYGQRYYNDRNQVNWAKAVNAVRAPNGQIVCASTLTNPNDGCVPANVFGLGTLTPEVAAYVLGEPHSFTASREYAAAANISGEPFNSWAGPVSLAFGVEWRREALKTSADSLSNTPGTFRVSPAGVDTSGKFKVLEGYAETVVPLAKDAPWAKSLELNGAVRQTHYSVSGSVTTWKVGLTYEPFDTVRFRFARSRDIRAPNISEFFQSNKFGSGGTVIDRATNIQYGPQTMTGGNRNLKPEEADNLTFGIVWQPDGALHGFRTSADYFDIDLQGAIGTLTAQQIEDYCFAGDASKCALITRNAAGAITVVNQTTQNLGYLKTSGIDFEADYNFTNPIGDVGGDFNLRVLATWVKDLIVSDGGTNIVHYEGSEAGRGVPDWQLSTRLSYDRERFHAFIENQYIPSMILDATLKYPLVTADPATNHIRSMNWTNLSVSYDFDVQGGRVQAYATVNNVFDQQPPVTPNSGIQSQQTDEARYDSLGRRYLLGFRFKF